MSKEREFLKKLRYASLLENDLRKELEEFLAQPEQEPVAWIDDGCNGLIKQDTIRGYVMPLYTAPPKREHLSDEAICEILLKKEWKGFVDLVRIIEKAHGIGGGE